MLDEFRRRIASAISSPPEVKIDKKSEVKVDANRSAPLQVMSGQSPNIPVYSDMSIRKATREGYKISVFVYRAVRTIVQAASGIPWIAIDTDGTPLLDHPFTTAWAKPNKEFSGQDNMEFLIAHLLLCGNALVQPLIVSGKPKEFWMVMPDLVSPIPSDAPGEWLKGWQVVTSKGEQKILPPTQFIHFQQVDPGNPYWGIGPLMAAARTVDTDNEAQDTQKISMQNRGVTDGVFTHEAVLTAEQFEEARRQIREKFLDKSRRREPWVLGAGAKWNQMSLTPIEMDFIASRLANLRAIAAAFGLDPWWLGDRSSSTYNNVMEARKALYEDVVVPILDDIKSTLNLKVAPLYGDIEIGYDLSGVAAMREDFGKKVTQAQALWTMGVPFDQINERLEMGFEEFEGWGSGYLSAALIPTGSSGMPEPPVASEGGAAGKKDLKASLEEAKSSHWKRIDQRRSAYWNAMTKRILPLYQGEMDAVLKVIGESKGEGQPPDAPRDDQGRWTGEGGGGGISDIGDERRYGTSGEDDPKFSDNVHSSVSNFHQKYKDSDIENLQVIGSDGKPIGSTSKGIASGVDLTDRQDKLIADGKVSVIVHNHPNDIPIWTGDVRHIALALDNPGNLRSIVTVTKDEISAFSAKDWKGSHKDMASAYWAAERGWYSTMGNKVDSSRYGKQKGYVELCHRANENAAKAAGWKYERYPAT